MFYSKSKCSNVWIVKKVDQNLDEINLSNCNQECKDSMRPPVCRPSLFNADWSLPLVVTVINSMRVFEVIVHKFRVLTGGPVFCISGFLSPRLLLSCHFLFHM